MDGATAKQMNTILVTDCGTVTDRHLSKSMGKVTLSHYYYVIKINSMT